MQANQEIQHNVPHAHYTYKQSLPLKQLLPHTPQALLAYLLHHAPQPQHTHPPSPKEGEKKKLTRVTHPPCNSQQARRVIQEEETAPAVSIHTHSKAPFGHGDADGGERAITLSAPCVVFQLGKDQQQQLGNILANTNAYPNALCRRSLFSLSIPIASAPKGETCHTQLT